MLVGLGASAGGVEALMQFFGLMPDDTGMAFVVVLHLSPEHESRLAEVLRTKTGMPVEQVTEPVRVEPNRVYVIPPDKNLYMSDGHIRLAERGQEDGHPAPVDLFFRTLADNYRDRAVAVVLSGAGADGSVGVRRIKEEGGVTIAQEPGEAEHAQMPRAAVETGAVDFVLPVAAMPERLASLHRNADHIQLPSPEEPPPNIDEDALREVLGLLRVRTRHDFSDYKRSTLLRRLERRMQVTETENIPDYLAHVREHPEELLGLLDDLLISVTNFFRDREAFDQLETEVAPALLAGKGAGEQVRVWVAGCATGEEAYSLAMLLAESAARHSRPPAVQVFASDIDENALGRAREGVYPEAIAADVSPERLKRFFDREGQYYRVKRELRELVLFAPHNVLRDPPFSKLDLVSCRNLLIYINRQTQERVLEIFHFALRPGGHLFLGSSETAEGMPGLFAPVDKKHRLFRRLDLPAAYRGAPALPVVGRWEARSATAFRTPLPGAGVEPPSFGELHYYTLEALGPPSVLVNAEYDIVHASEQAGRFLRFPGREPSRNLLAAAHPDLQLELRSLLLKAAQTGGASRDVAVQLDGARRTVRVGVRPVAFQRLAPGFLLVVFEELPEPAASQTPERPGDGAGAEPAAEVGEGLEPVVRQLEEEMQRMREQLRATVEMYETQAEEFKAANEELQPMNEELRSASEELETGKEELQSVNEELTTVNAELKERVEEVGRANSDLQNLMHATQIGTLFLDRALHIKRYTPGMQEFFNLIPGDVGRPFAHLTHRLDYAGLVEDAEAVLKTLHSVERETGTREGRFFLVRLIPYRTTDDRIDGVVITFVDITERKAAEERLSESEEQFRRAIEDAPIPVIMHAEDGEVLQVSRTWTELTGYTLEDVPTFEAWLTRAYGEGADAVRNHMRELFKGSRRTLNIEFPVRTREGGLRHWSFSASSPGTLRDNRRFIVGMAVDISERMLTDEALHRSEQRLRSVVEGVTDYAIVTQDAEGRVESWNTGAERMFGYAADEMIGRSIEILFTPEDRAQGAHLQEMRQARDTGRASDERWHVRKDGTLFYASGVMSPLGDNTPTGGGCGPGGAKPPRRAM
jgi:two-component system CheB/CheR fusion protein